VVHELEPKLIITAMHGQQHIKIFVLLSSPSLLCRISNWI